MGNFPSAFGRYMSARRVTPSRIFAGTPRSTFTSYFSVAALLAGMSRVPIAITKSVANDFRLPHSRAFFGPCSISSLRRSRGIRRRLWRVGPYSCAVKRLASLPHDWNKALRAVTREGHSADLDERETHLPLREALIII